MPHHSPRLTVVIPTFNERANIGPAMAALTVALRGLRWEAIIVDDDSPDGTALAARALAATCPNLRVIHRIGRRGQAGACIEGILSASAPLVVVMDADLQHDESLIVQMLQRLDRDPDLDLVVASRFAPGGQAAPAPGRARLRQVSDWLARRRLGITASTDPMSRFFMLRQDRFAAIAPDLQTSGFNLLADILLTTEGNWQTIDLPYAMRPRPAGGDGADPAVSLEFLGLMLARLSRGLFSVRLVLFSIVGLGGVATQLATVWLLLGVMPQDFALTQAAGVFVAMTTNFLLNNQITYRDRMLRGAAVLRGLASYYAVGSIGALVNVGVATAVFASVPNWALASLAGGVIGSLWNFIASALITWRAQ